MPHKDWEKNLMMEYSRQELLALMSQKAGHIMKLSIRKLCIAPASSKFLLSWQTPYQRTVEKSLQAWRVSVRWYRKWDLNLNRWKRPDVYPYLNCELRIPIFVWRTKDDLKIKHKMCLLIGQLNNNRSVAFALVPCSMSPVYCPSKFFLIQDMLNENYNISLMISN